MCEGVREREGKKGDEKRVTVEGRARRERGMDYVRAEVYEKRRY